MFAICNRTKWGKWVKWLVMQMMQVRIIRYPMSQLARNVSKCLLYWLLHKRTGTIGTPIKTSTDTTLVQSTEMYNFVPLLLYLVAQVTIALDIEHTKSRHYKNIITNSTTIMCTVFYVLLKAIFPLEDFRISFNMKF